MLTDPIDGYGRDNITNVWCNSGVNPTVRAGSSFTCQVSVDGTQRQVTAVFSDDAGTYEVDRPVVAQCRSRLDRPDPPQNRLRATGDREPMWTADSLRR